MTSNQARRPAVPSDCGSDAAPARAQVRVWDRWVDRFAGSDPGLNRFRIALQSALTIAVSLATEWLFAHFTHALQIQAHGARLPAVQAAQVALANHGSLVIAMLIGAIVGLLASFGIVDKTARDQLVTTLLLPVPMIAALALGIALGGHRLLALVSLAVIVGRGHVLAALWPAGLHRRDRAVHRRLPRLLPARHGHAG